MKCFHKKIMRHLRNGTAFWVAQNFIRIAVRKIDRLLLIARRDVSNRFFYGAGAPKFCERLWVDPRGVDEMVTNESIVEATGMHRDKASGLVINWSSIKEFLPLVEQPKIDFCLRHWRDGVSWDELGYYDLMATRPRHVQWTRSQIIDRFRMLDEAYNHAKLTGALKTRSQLDPRAFREEDGILMHIGPGGHLVFGGNGFHRLAIAMCLGLRKIPVCVGVVDISAVPLLGQFRH